MAHPITVEVVRNAVVAYADEMAHVLAKSAYNMMIYEVRDYCCGLLDVQGRMIAQNRGGLPIFLADLGPAGEDGIERYGFAGFPEVRGGRSAKTAGGLPIFLADLGPAVEDGIERYGLAGFKPGDVLIMNHGAVCGQHLNNVVIYAPCFHEGQVVGFAASRAHWVDIGGMRDRKR